MQGTRVGSYRILDQLGEGGMGAVYVAEHVLLGKKVAVKVLLPEYTQNAEIVQRFFNEARAATRIQHPGIVEVFDFGHDQDGAAYIVMELLRGEPLSARIRREGRLEPAAAARLLTHVAGALGQAHREGIVHRDLKPDNIFLVPDPDVAGGERAKVLDFGIAKLATDAGAAGVKTRTGMLFGTPVYMAPEQCRGASAVDARADIYALAVILFEMVVGQPPFTAEGVGDLIAKHMFEAPPRPRSLRPTLPPALDEVLGRALAKRPEERYSTVEAFASEVTAAVGAHAPAASVLASPAIASAPTIRAAHGLDTTLGGAAGHVAPRTTLFVRHPRLIAGSLSVLGLAAAVLITLHLSSGPADELSARSAAEVPASSPDPSPGSPGSPPPVIIDARAPEVALVADAALVVDAAEPPEPATPPAPPKAPVRRAPGPAVTTPSEPKPASSAAMQVLANAERAQASGQAQRAIDLARTVMREPEARVRAYRVLVLAYCQLHNAEAARAVYRDLPAANRGGLAAPCRRSGVQLP